MGLSQIAATLAVVGVPFALSAGVAFLTGALRRHRSITTTHTAGEWLTDAISAVPNLRCGVSPQLAGDADGYWPHAKTITLAANTWRGVDADAQAIAAHELGHAIEHRNRPALANRLALARRLNGAVTQTFVASALITALFAAPALLPIVGISLLLSITLGMATLVEEGLASRAAHRWLAIHEPRQDVRKRVTLGLGRTSQREATWEFHAALVIFVWATLAPLHPWSRPYAPLVVLAAIPAMGPLAHLGRGMTLVPVIAAWAVGAHVGVWGGWHTSDARAGTPPHPILSTCDTPRRRPYASGTDFSGRVCTTHTSVDHPIRGGLSSLLSADAPH
ncbi:MAG: hypothetical protein ACJATT_001497 [Myxococcota bacterium]